MNLVSAEEKKESAKQANASRQTKFTVKVVISESLDCESFFYQPLDGNLPWEVIEDFVNTYSRWKNEEESFNFTAEFAYHFRDAKIQTKISSQNVLAFPDFISHVTYGFDLQQKKVKIESKIFNNLPFIFEHGHEEEREQFFKILDRLYFLGFDLNGYALDILKLKAILRVFQ